jgi:hypothetical protein
VDPERPDPVVAVLGVEPDAEVVVGVGERRPADRDAGEDHDLVVGDERVGVGGAAGHGPLGHVEVVGVGIDRVDAVDGVDVADDAVLDELGPRCLGSLPEAFAETHDDRSLRSRVDRLGAAVPTHGAGQDPVGAGQVPVST